MDVMGLSIIIMNIMSFLVLFGLRKKATIKLMVWGAVTLTVICLEVFGFFCYWKYKEVYVTEQIIGKRCLFGENRHGCGGITAAVYIITAIVFWSLGVFYLGMMAFFFNQVNYVIGIMGAALKVTMKSSEIKSVPVYGGLTISIVCIVLIFVVIQAGSIGNVKKIDATSSSSLTRH